MRHFRRTIMYGSDCNSKSMDCDAVPEFDLEMVSCFENIFKIIRWGIFFHTILAVVIF